MGGRQMKDGVPDPNWWVYIVVEVIVAVVILFGFWIAFPHPLPNYPKISNLEPGKIYVVEDSAHIIFPREYFALYLREENDSSRCYKLELHGFPECFERNVFGDLTPQPGDRIMQTDTGIIKAP